jgi:hypothetical protein
MRERERDFWFLRRTEADKRNTRSLIWPSRCPATAGPLGIKPQARRNVQYQVNRAGEEGKAISVTGRGGS